MNKTEIKNIRQQTLSEIVKQALFHINEDSNMTNAEVIYGNVLINSAKEGDLKAIDMLTKLAGEDTPDKIEVKASVEVSHEDAIALIKQTVEGE